MQRISRAIGTQATIRKSSYYTMAKSLPSLMRAVQHDRSTQTLALVNIPLPKPSANEHLIRVAAVAPTTGELLWPRPEDLTVSVPGVDAAGTVVIAPANSKFQPGSQIYYRTAFPRPGSTREYSIALENELALKPETASFVDASAVPVSALTAWQALFDQAGLSPPSTSGQASSSKQVRILVNGASGGVGIWLVQLAHLTGATVIGTCSTKNIDFLKSLGADEIIDYTVQGPKAWAEEDSSRKADFVFDCVGRKSLAEVWHTVKNQGRLLTIVPAEDMQWKFDLETPEGVDESVVGTFFIMHPDSEQLGKVSKLIDEGKCNAVVDSVYSLDDYDAAFKRVDSGRAVGKIVIKVSDD